jgi:hypothetical protein
MLILVIDTDGVWLYHLLGRNLINFWLFLSKGVITMHQFPVLLQTRSLGLNFDDFWTQMVAFLTDDPVGPLLYAAGGLLLMFLAARMLLDLIGGHRAS